MSVGWKLAEEVAWARPERPGPEWWVLLDIAQDARDETRQSMPGHGYLAKRAKCSERTVRRKLKALTDAGLIKVVRHSAPGIRAIYEIMILHTTPATNGDLCITGPTPATNADRRSPDNTGHFPDQHRPLSDQHRPRTLTATPSPSPVTDTPSTEALDLDPSPVEGARARPGQAPMTSIERAAWQAAAERLRRERQETQ